MATDQNNKKREEEFNRIRRKKTSMAVDNKKMEKNLMMF